MAPRKSEVAKRRADSDFPHRVAVHIPQGGLGLLLMEMHIFCAQRAMPYHTRAERRDAGDFVCFAFAKPADAKTFASMFPGERIDVDTPQGHPPT
jgi:hypothetical protein